MSLSKRYNPQQREPELQRRWLETAVYHFDPAGDEPVYSIDTPPPTVSGHLHLGHTYSYSQTDFFARFWRMNGYNVFYPMGFDDNGLPTERLVERWEGVNAAAIGRHAFIERCLATGAKAAEEYAEIWKRLGLSVDWRYTYRTIGDDARRLAQWSFIDLYRQGLAYRKKAPSIWCPECQTAIAQAEVDELERESVFYTLTFVLDDGEPLPIATTRPELLPACVAIFVHPDDARASALAGHTATVPLFGQQVPLLVDPAVDPEKGTGVVMCCTFGDTADVAWWRSYQLPLVEAIGRDGRLLAAAGDFAGLPVKEARRQLVRTLEDESLLGARQRTPQTVRVHERCDTPVEYILTQQWFIRVLDNKEQFLRAGDEIRWHPPHMAARYRQWVENLAWDWCISRQRAFGVTFPLWYCDRCGEIILADERTLPVDPMATAPPHACSHCGDSAYTPETDVMDTWATSSLTPQIAGEMLTEPALYEKVVPFSLRPQAHEIIRTWAFTTIVKSLYHFEALPWHDVAISGWGLAPEGSGKISKSRGGGPATPIEMMERYSADAIRYWAASTGLGKDNVIDEQKIQAGAKLATKLWNVARFSQRFLAGYHPPEQAALRQANAHSAQPNAPLPSTPSPNQALSLTPADRWLLSRTHRLIRRATERYRNYDYATAKSEIEVYFWTELADNYLEMAKQRLYDGGPESDGARLTLYQALLTTLKLLAPIMPHVTEAIYHGLLETEESIHRSAWPQADETLLDETAEMTGQRLVEIATAVRRYKSEAGLSLGASLTRLHLSTAVPQLQRALRAAEPDLASVTRAQAITVAALPDPELTLVEGNGNVTIALQP